MWQVGFGNIRISSNYVQKKLLDIGVIRKVSLCFDIFWVHYSHKPMETQSKALEFRGIIHKARV